MQLNAHFGLAFATAPWLDHLTLLHTSKSPAHYAKGTPSAVQGPKSSPCLRLLVSGWFQVLFIPLPGCFSPFPHGTIALSVVREYLALGGGPPGFTQDFTCPALLGYRLKEPACFRLQGYHLLWPAFPGCSTNKQVYDSSAFLQEDPCRPRNPHDTTPAGFNMSQVSAVSCSLAATEEIEVSFSSWRY